MKKLNKKGFTLIELLAVIVVLAIILVITIPTVIGSMDNARANSLQNATDSVAAWVEKQWGLFIVDTNQIDTNFQTFLGGTEFSNVITLSSPEADAADIGKKCTGTSSKCGKITLSNGTNDIALLKAAGLNVSNKDIKEGKIGIDKEGRACVELTAQETGGKFSTRDTNEKSSSGCATSQP